MLELSIMTMLRLAQAHLVKLLLSFQTLTTTCIMMLQLDAKSTQIHRNVKF